MKFDHQNYFQASKKFNLPSKKLLIFIYGFIIDINYYYHLYLATNLKGGGNRMNAIQKSNNINRLQDIQTVAELPLAGQMTVWGVRLLATGYRLDVNMSSQLMKSFSKAGANRAGAALILFMDSLFKHLSRNFDFNCQCNPGISQDERLVLEICSFCEADIEVDQSIRSFEIVDPAHSAIIFSLLREYTHALYEAGLSYLSSSRQNYKQGSEELSHLMPAYYQ